MLRSAEFFKDETLQGISRAIKHLHQMQAEAFSQKMKNFGITKSNPHFRSLLNHLDMALSLGLEEPHKGYWPLMKKVCHKATIQMVESHEDATDSTTRGRIWLFLAFIESSLVGYLKVLKESKKLLKWFYKKYALLRDEERYEILQQLVIGLEMVNFVLDFNSPFLGYGREPMFKPSDFYGGQSPATAMKTADSPSSASSSPYQSPAATIAKPDVTITTLMGGTGTGATPDLLCKASSSQDRASLLAKSERKLDVGGGDGLVTHLKTKKRDGSSRRRKPISRSESSTNELEEDNYIPEFQDSWPITVVVPDKPLLLDSSLHQVTSETSIEDESVYQNFLMKYEDNPESKDSHMGEDQMKGLSLDQEINVTEAKNSRADPRLFSPEPDVFIAQAVETFNGHEKNEHQDKEADSGHENHQNNPETKCKGEPEYDKHEVHEDQNCCGEDHDYESHIDLISSSFHSEEAYRITYVSDDENESEAQHDQSHEKYRSASLDSFDRFCRSGSVGVDHRKKSSAADDDDDDDDDECKLKLSSAIETSENSESQTSNRDISLDSDAITSSPMSEKLPKASVDKVLHARFDTTTGILLPTLPRRPGLSNACEMYQGLSLEQNVLLLLSLEVFEKSTETFKKLFDVYVGYLFGCRKRVSLLITSDFLYLLTRQEKQEAGYLKELSLPLDSINRIQTGLSMQDVLISHDNGKIQLWTGDEVATKNIILTLSSELKSGDARTVSVEQMKVDVHSNLEFVINDWLLFLEDIQEPEIFHFALVDFYSINAQEPELKVLKSGHLHHKQSYLGMVPYWEQSIFGLRGSSLYEYSGKGVHELKNVYDLGMCGGCVRMKTADKANALKILNKDGSTPLLELAAESEEEANDWIVNICQVVVDAKHGRNTQIVPYSEGVSPRGLLLTANKLYLFIQEARSGRLVLMDSCTVQDITQVCIDNQDRSYCAMLIDDSIDNYLDTEKRTWVLKFNSEYELGKFEQTIFAAWHLLYQVPLQFVLLADNDLKATIRRHISAGRSEACFSVDERETPVSKLVSL